ncbi:MAG: pantoate--beta-alanine ligase [Cyclobacteriaceae bacterium]|nr:pantoate--beta-alanine ligase [Cyclobacteriaceae bacterium HetDA_MAG_MS6]
MIITKNEDELREFLNTSLSKGMSLGLVPTMGALHDGHLHLISNCHADNDVVVVSIFINPLQFNEKSDFDRYPSDLAKDIDKLKGTGCDCLYTPDPEEFYPELPKVHIAFGELEQRLEGKYRPGHFRGVGLVVAKLFHQLTPTRAYFGLKDLQQFVLIKQMAHDLSFPVQIIGVETVRDHSGLAMSSRNQRLSDKGRNTACQISRGLALARKDIEKQRNPVLVLKAIKDYYQNTKDLEIEYCELVNAKTLEPIETYSDVSTVALCVAGYIEGVRLIDNLYLQLD